jgi:hypothetical protein
MSDKTIRLLIDLTYNQDIMHGDDEEAIEWFNDILLGDNLHLGDFGDLGDMIGSVKVVPHAADRIKELEAENKRLRSFVADVIADTGDDPEIMAASRAEWAARALEAEAKLENAILALSEAIYLLDPDEEDIAKETGLHRIVTTYRELKGEK